MHQPVDGLEGPASRKETLELRTEAQLEALLYPCFRGRPRSVQSPGAPRECQGLPRRLHESVDHNQPGDRGPLAGEVHGCPIEGRRARLDLIRDGSFGRLEDGVARPGGDQAAGRIVSRGESRVVIFPQPIPRTCILETRIGPRGTTSDRRKTPS